MNILKSFAKNYLTSSIGLKKRKNLFLQIANLHAIQTLLAYIGVPKKGFTFLGSKKILVNIIKKVKNRLISKVDGIKRIRHQIGNLIQFFEIKYQKKRKIECTMNLGNSEREIFISKRLLGRNRNGEIPDSEIQ